MRFPSLDMLRGFAVLTMLFINFITPLSFDLPWLLKHNQLAMLPADLIAPLFQFILGISLTISVSRRKAKGEDVRIHVLRRAMLLLLLGFFLSSSLNCFTQLEWGVLQTLGIGVLLGYALLPFSPFWRIMAAFALLACYALLLMFYQPFYEAVLLTTFSGPLGALSYCAVTIFGTVAGHWLYSGKSRKLEMIAIFGLALMLLAILGSALIPFNRLTASPTYTLFAGGLFFPLAAFFYFVGELKGKSVRMLLVLGRNALSLWVAQYILFYWFLFSLLAAAASYHGLLALR